MSETLKDNVALAFKTCNELNIAREAADVANFAMMIQDRYWK